MNNYPKVSIITPSFNQGQFIEEAITSVLNQNYENFEHIIIDGGSTDNTLEILKKYHHLIWISETDDGQSDAINKGFRIAKGDIVGWLNTDDYYLPDTFSAASKAFSDRRIDAVYSNFRITDIYGNIQRELITQKSSKWMSLFYCIIPSETLFFRREILDKGIFIDKQFHISMDKEFIAHVLHSGFRIQKVDAYFAHFRKHSNNKSIETKTVKLIVKKEGLEIFNRYSGYRLPENSIGLAFYEVMRYFTIFYRGVSRLFKIWVYSKKLK